MQNTIKDYYKRIRANGATAARAYELAQSNFAANRKLYDIPVKKYIEYNIAGDDGLRWIENASQGLRFTGYCDKINRFIDHTGWFTNEFQEEKLRGVVYQLPARKGKAQFIAGYTDPCNDDCARIDFNNIYDDENEAARAADRIAEKTAESEREYNEAWQAGNDYAEKGEELSTIRKATIELLQAIKNKQSEPVICKAIRSQINSQLAEYSELKNKRADLIDRFNASYQRAIWHAFNDGAGNQIITN